MLPHSHPLSATQKQPGKQIPETVIEEEDEEMQKTQWIKLNHIYSSNSASAGSTAFSSAMQVAMLKAVSGSSRSAK